ncbi:MAG: HEPN domain-containing protein [Sulfuricellaceae bacterium]
MPQNDSRLESAAQWFHYAEADMRAAKLLRDAKEHPAACFHAQQAVEKAFNLESSVDRLPGSVTWRH